MGWLRDDGVEWHYDHEGYLIGVIKDGQYGGWRDLGLDDRAIDSSHGWMIQVGCECGWRSHRMAPPLGAEWAPCAVFFRFDGEVYEEAGVELWRKHLDETTDDSRHHLMVRGRELRRVAS